MTTFSRKSGFVTLVKFSAECPELAVRAIPICLLSDCHFFQQIQNMLNKRETLINLDRYDDIECVL